MIIKGTQRCYLPPPIHTRFEYPAFSSSFTARMERTPPSQPTTIFSSNSGNASFTSSTNFSFFSVNVVPCAQARNCCTFLSSPVDFSYKDEQHYLRQAMAFPPSQMKGGHQEAYIHRPNSRQSDWVRQLS